jgi:hypothetical protein
MKFSVDVTLLKANPKYHFVISYSRQYRRDECWGSWNGTILPTILCACASLNPIQPQKWWPSVAHLSIRELTDKINAGQEELKTEINAGQEGLKNDTKSEISAVKNDIENSISALETKINAGQEELRQEISVRNFAWTLCRRSLLQIMNFNFPHSSPPKRLHGV